MVNIRKLVTDSVPAFEIGHLEAPSPAMPGGVKGMGAEDLA